MMRRTRRKARGKNIPLWTILLILAAGLTLGAYPRQAPATAAPPQLPTPAPAPVTEAPLLGETRPEAPTTCRQPERPAVRSGSGAKTLPVLIYHHLAPADLGLHEKNPMIIPVEGFVEQMAWLRDEGYYTPTLREVEAFLAGQLDLPARSVLITFDDGYESNYHYAHPVLCAAGLRAVLYRIGNRPPSPGPFDATGSTYLTWQQAAEMQQSGIWAVENHTYAGHEKVKGEAPLQVWTGAEIEADLVRLGALWQEKGLPAPTSIAYPFGAYSEKAVDAVRRAGLRTGFTVVEGRVKPGMDPLRLPRLAIFPWHSLKQFQQIVRGG